MGLRGFVSSFFLREKMLWGGLGDGLEAASSHVTRLSVRPA
jgi:hypothetical protein